jgi:hypothetical protein
LTNLSQADISEQQKHGNLNQKREISFPSTQEEKLKKQKKPSIRQLRIRPDNQIGEQKQQQTFNNLVRSLLSSPAAMRNNEPENPKER